LLERRGVPYVFATGYGAAGLEPRFRNGVIVQKPYDAGDIKDAIESALAP
jgi:hypothetical protein